MSARRRAGDPETPRRPAGAPPESRPPAGTPGSEAGGGPAPGRRQTGPAEGAAAGSDPGRRQTRPVPDPATAHPERPEEERVEKDLDELVEDLKRERDQYLDLAQRARADFENYRKRAARDSQEAERRGKAGLARELVPVLDNLERALRAAGIDPDVDDPAEEDGGGLAHGVRLVFRDLRSTLERAGVETYDPLGKRFDPAWHEALASRVEEGAEPGIVLETVEKGYRLDGQVLRAARVIVSAEDEEG